MLENTNTKQTYPGPILNTTLQISTFLFKDPEQVKLTKTYTNDEGIQVEENLTYGTDYEVTKTLADDISAADASLTASVGEILLKPTVSVLAGQKLTAYRESELTQEVSYPRTGPFPAKTHEGALDYLTMQNQEQQEQIDRSLKVPVSTGQFNASMPIPIAARALKINSEGTGFEMSEYDPDLALVITEEFKKAAQEAAENAQAAQATSENIQTSVENIQTDINTTYAAEQLLYESIQTTSTTALNDITTAKDTAVGAVQSEGDTQVARVQSTGFYMEDGIIYYYDNEGNPKKYQRNTYIIGQIFSIPANSNYIPNNTVYIGEQSLTYSGVQGEDNDMFHELYETYLSGDNPKLSVMSMESYDSAIADKGYCTSFGVDDTTKTFKMPYIPDGMIMGAENSAPIAGTGKTLGLTNGTANVGLTSFPSSIYGNRANTSTAAYGANVTSSQSQVDSSAAFGLLGVTTNASKSGIIAQTANILKYEAVKWFIVVSNDSTDTNEISATWSNYQSSLNLKTGIDADNLSSAGKKYISRLAMPSTKYIDLTLGASGTTYTAPANGYFQAQLRLASDNEEFSFNNITSTLKINNKSTASNCLLRLYIPAKEGDKVKCEYGNLATTNPVSTLQFIYAEGAQ